MKKILISLVCLIVISGTNLVMAQVDGSAVYVCRDPQTETVRHEFHNIPAEWFSSETINIWLLADGSAFYPKQGIVVTDALVPESPGMQNDGVEVGQSILGLTDYSFQIIGDANSPICDVALSPKEESDSVPPSPTPVPVSNTIPVSLPVSVSSCDYPKLRAWDSGKGVYYCYIPLNTLGTAPIPDPVS